LISFKNFASVSFKFNFEIPPAACSCPPPLKYFDANILTLKSPFDLKDILISPSSLFSIKITEQTIPFTVRPKFTNPSESPFLKLYLF